jgi:hypothetical protein
MVLGNPKGLQGIKKSWSPLLQEPGSSGCLLYYYYYYYYWVGFYLFTNYWW